MGSFAAVDIYLHNLEDGTPLGALMDAMDGAGDLAMLGIVLVLGVVLGLLLGPDRIGMALMPISSALCWSLLAFWPTHYQAFGFLLPCAGFYWCWACKNRLLGPILTDGGVLTFLPGVVAGALAMIPRAPLHPTLWRGGCYVAATLLPGANFLVPVLWFARSRPTFAQISARYGKRPPFGACFYVYCCSQCAFFPAAALYFAYGSSLDASTTAFGVVLAVALAVATKAAVGLLNAPIIARDKEARRAAKAQAKSAA